MKKSALQGIRLLFVDDNESLRESTCLFLSERLSALYLAANGREALVMLKSLKPDVLVTDFEMPGMTGLQLAGEARMISPDLPIILTSGHNLPEPSYLQAGISCFLPKPFTPDSLIDILTRILVF